VLYQLSYTPSWCRRREGKVLDAPNRPRQSASDIPLNAIGIRRG
jgi:hypothetical protein